MSKGEETGGAAAMRVERLRLPRRAQVELGKRILLHRVQGVFNNDLNVINFHASAPQDCWYASHSQHLTWIVS